MTSKRVSSPPKLIQSPVWSDASVTRMALTNVPFLLFSSESRHSPCSQASLAWRAEIRPSSSGMSLAWSRPLRSAVGLPGQAELERVRGPAERPRDVDEVAARLPDVRDVGAALLLDLVGEPGHRGDRRRVEPLLVVRARLQE